MTLALILALSLTPQASESPRITIQVDKEVARVSPSMYGVFFEEINQAGEGGIYAELIQNRGMQDGDASKLPTGWTSFGDGGTATVDETVPLNDARRHSIRIERTSESGRFGVANGGFWGVPLRKGGRYRLTLWLRGESPVHVSLEGSKELASARIDAPGPTWRRVERVLVSSGDEPKGRLTLEPVRKGSMSVAFASLMPLDTWKGRANGMRPDLARHVEGMRPAFVRFPGGCFVEGKDLGQAFDWKKTIGPVDQRRGSASTFWGYPTSDGLGFHEYLQWCEDLGAEALFVANCGLSHSQIEPMETMDRWVQDTLDAIEYANGPATSKWGAQRAKNGHPKPFNLKYIEIGNENGYSWANGGPAAYSPRYRVMYDAIKRTYPGIVTIADVPVPHPTEIIDEHYYETPAWFWRNSTRYDRYDRNGPKIYVGEYAVTRGAGTGNLAAALGEAAFMAGMERNSDVVTMTSYAPLLVNVNNRQWNPNAIVFDAGRSYGTPSYHVQAMFGQNRPDRIVAHTVTAPPPPPPPISGTVGLLTWRTDAEFRDVQVVADGRMVYSSAGAKMDDLNRLAGQWSVTDGTIRQSDLGERRGALIKGLDLSGVKKYTLTLKARKLAGNEGFIVIMDANADGQWLWWNIAGWGNTQHAFEWNGAPVGRPMAGAIESNRWYEIRLEREGNRTRGYLDGKLVQELVETGVPTFAAVAGVDKKAKELVVKVVNGAETSQTATIELPGARLGRFGNAIVLTGPSLAAENSFDNPELVSPRRTRIANVSNRMSYTFEPRSVTVLRIALR
jgi:alpha-L-arabinofuranosidase